VLIALLVIGTPLVTFALLTLESSAARLAVLTGWLVLFGAVALVFRLRFERMNRKQDGGA
jgi:hypothetical protein